jgi:hypothetical protein
MSELKCPNCSVALSDEARADGWCPDCGKRVPPMLLARAARPDAPREPRPWLLYVCVGLLFATAAVGGVMWSMVKKREIEGWWVAIPVGISFALSLAMFVARARGHK